jgi:hypothetical protein
VIPSSHRLVPHSRGKPSPTAKAIGVKSNEAKLSGEGTLRPLELNLLIWIVQFIVLSEDISNRMAPVRGNNPNKLADLDDSIRHQLVQLHSKLTQNVQKNWVWGHTKPNSKEILEHNSFVRPRVRHRLRSGGSTISFGKIVTVVSKGHEAGFCHSRLPKIESDTSQSSRISNL